MADARSSMSFANGLRKLARRLTGRGGETLTEIQELFVRWNAERLAISVEESRARYARSRAAFPTGHAGAEYRAFNDLCYEVHQVFHGEAERELMEAYRFHGPMHLLRQISYPEQGCADEGELVRALGPRAPVTLVDYGCGMAQQSRSLARALERSATKATLVLVDLRTLRTDFLLWLAARQGLSAVFLECNPTVPVPELPDCDVCFATEFFEHVYDPLAYLERFDRVLRPGGFLVTAIQDHQREFMHVSPYLGALRNRLAEGGYRTLREHVLYQKPG